MSSYIYSFTFSIDKKGKIIEEKKPSVYGNKLRKEVGMHDYLILR